MPRASRDPLILPETEIAKRVLPAGKEKLWPGIAVALERRGLPKIDPLVGGRYWPAVKSFLDRHYGVGKDAAVPDGEDNYDGFFD